MKGTVDEETNALKMTASVCDDLKNMRLFSSEKDKVARVNAKITGGSGLLQEAMVR